MSDYTTESIKQLFDTHDFTPDAPGTYENMEYGINLEEISQELKDNSDDAGATRTDIFVLPRGKEDPLLDTFACLDDAKGMVPETLCKSINKSLHHYHNSEDTGQFGDGLKNAIFGLGDEITILTRTEGNEAIGMYLNVPKMKKNSTFKPTSMGFASQYKDLVDDDIWKMFCNLEHGTLIYVSRIKNVHIMDVKKAAERITHGFQLANTSNRGNNLYIHTSTTSLSPTPVEVLDPFYRKNPSSLEYSAETDFRVCIFPDGHVEVYEYLTAPRWRGSRTGNKYINGSTEHPTIWKFTGLLPDKTKGVNRRAYDKACHEQVPSLPSGVEVYPIKIRIVKVKEDMYKQEAVLYPALRNVENRRRGFWVYRLTRLLIAAINMDMSLDDHSNRVRVEVVFPPKLGKYMGVSTKKTMGNRVPNQAISNALKVFWKQMETKLCKSDTARDDASTVADDDDRSTVVSTSRNPVPTPAPAPAPAPKKVKKMKVAVPTTKAPTQGIVEMIKQTVKEEEEKEQEETTNQVLSVSSGSESETEVQQDTSLPVFDSHTGESPTGLQITRFEEVHTPTPPSSPVIRPGDCVQGNIRFDLTTNVVIVSRIDDSLEIARFSNYGHGSGLRDHLKAIAERMSNDEKFATYIQKRASLDAEFRV